MVSAQRDEEAGVSCVSDNLRTEETQKTKLVLPPLSYGVLGFSVIGSMSPHDLYIVTVSPSTLDGYVFAKLPVR